MTSSELQQVLAKYSLDGSQPIEPLGNAGGFSGAQLFRLVQADRTLCLRRWPAEHPLPDRLSWIHRVLAHVAEAGVPVAAPLPDCGGQTIVLAGGHCWELTPWMAGKADFHQRPSRLRLRSAVETIARFHQASLLLHREIGPAPGVIRKRQFAQDCHAAAARLVTAVDHSAVPHRPILLEILNTAIPSLPRLLEQLDRFVTVPLPLQPVLRDIWHDHLLFTQERVTGVVDFGAMQVDTVASDLARMLGSLVRNDRSAWTEAIGVYGQLAPLSADELLAIDLMDQANRLLSGFNWARWLVEENRNFEDSAHVEQRLREILQRL